MANKMCQKCGKMLNEELKFYSKRDGGKADLCKSCLTLHVDNFDPSTFLWILEELDVPYVESEWIGVRDKAFAKNPNLNGMSVLGKYLSKIRLNQWAKYRWADTEKIAEIRMEENKKKKENEERRNEIAKQQFENGDINEAQYKTLVSTDIQNENYISNSIHAATNNPNDLYLSEDKMPDVELTDDEKIMLATKWGRLYKVSEWIELEKSYNEMMNSFDIQDADTINTLILLCKTNLKMNQAIDSADIESFQKLSKVSEALRKSAKFTAAQNKEMGNDYIDSVGELVAYCEKNGGVIPRYEINIPLDVIDTVVRDLKDYTRDLIYEDKSLAKQIEDYLKKAEILRQQKEDIEEAQSQGLEAVELKDKDFYDYNNYLEEQKNENEKIYNNEEATE